MKDNIGIFYRILKESQDRVRSKYKTKQNSFIKLYKGVSRDGKERLLRREDYDPTRVYIYNYKNKRTLSSIPGTH